MPIVPEDLALLVDCSASMLLPFRPGAGISRLEVARLACIELLATSQAFESDDRVIIVSFGTLARVECEWAWVQRERQRLVETVRSIAYRHESTPMLEAIELAAARFDRPHVSRRMVLISDGLGRDPDGAKALAYRLKRTGMHIDTFGVGPRGKSLSDLSEGPLMAIASEDDPTCYHYLLEASDLRNKYHRLPSMPEIPSLDLPISPLVDQDVLNRIRINNPIDPVLDDIRIEDE